jgi:hypothetical protein
MKVAHDEFVLLLCNVINDIKQVGKQSRNRTGTLHPTSRLMSNSCPDRQNSPDATSIGLSLRMKLKKISPI